jgi:hypothetical protein
LSIERCDFCREPVGEDRSFFCLGAATLVHCQRPECRANGKEWRVRQLKRAAIALGLAKSTVRAEVSKHDVSQPQE